MRKTDWCRLLCALLCITFLCSYAAPVEVPRDSMEEKASKPEPKVEIEVEWIETPTEIPEGVPELNGRLWEGPMPEGLDFRERLFTDGQENLHMIDLDGNLVRWGWNRDNFDAEWNVEDGIQPFEQRTVLLKNVRKFSGAYLTAYALDGNQDLWGWGSSFPLLMYDGDPYNPPREPIKIMSGVKDITGGDFYAAAVRTDGTLQVWGRQEGYREPVSIQTGVEKVYCMLELLMYIDQEHRLYCYPGAGSDHLENFLKEPLLLDTNVEDIGFLTWGLYLVQKTDGTVAATYYPSNPLVVLAEDCVQLAGSGYITADGTFWDCNAYGPGFSLAVQPVDSACSIFTYSTGDSVHIMKDGEIRVCMDEG